MIFSMLKVFDHSLKEGEGGEEEEVTWCFTPCQQIWAIGARQEEEEEEEEEEKKKKKIIDYLWHQISKEPGALIKT